jgi:transcriptional regulator with XRE-family HTH domain
MGRSSEFAAWLATQLRARRISQRQLAERSGVAHSTVSRILAGGRVPTLATANRLVRALGHESIHALEMAHDAVTRVERALRLDRLLDARNAHRIMQLYLSLRGRQRDSTDVAVRRVRESDRPNLGGGPPA